MAEGVSVETFRLRIVGRVQGVGYRAWTVHTARKMGLKGWVRNLTDGSVEGMVQGPRQALETMVAACQAGPPPARVIEVERFEVACEERFEAFRQLPTASPE